MSAPIQERSSAGPGPDSALLRDVEQRVLWVATSTADAGDARGPNDSGWRWAG